MRYGLLSTAAVAALALSVAVGVAQTSGGGAGGGGGGAATSPGASGGGASNAPSAAGGSGSGAASGQQSGGPAASGTSGSRPSAATGGSGQPGTQSGAATGQAGAAGASGSATGSVSTNITSEQRTQITRSFSSVSVAPVTNVNFSVSVGAVIPTTVEWHDLPVEVVRVVPAYRGYKYVLVGNRIVIIEPASRKIVTVIERTA